MTMTGKIRSLYVYPSQLISLGLASQRSQKTMQECSCSSHLLIVEEENKRPDFNLVNRSNFQLTKAL